MLKLHFGSGKVYIPGFIHIDLLDLEHIDYVMSIDNLNIFKDNSVDLIYNSHVLEHFSRKDTKQVLSEWYRVLKPKGILRTAVPNFEEICELYSETKDLSIVVGPVMGRQDSLYNIHYNIFDENTLKNLLLEIGFKTTYLYDWRKTEHSHIDDYSQAYHPHMDKENGRLISLNMEAIK